MASIQTRKETGCLIIDFYYKGVRCREQTAHDDTPVNRKKVQKLIDRIEADISACTFQYSRYFPNSKNSTKFDFNAAPLAAASLSTQVAGNAQTDADNKEGVAGTPLVRDFAEIWYKEKEIEWRRTHRKSVRADLDKLILPRWGDWEVGRITRADVLAYRADLGKVLVRGGTSTRGNCRINKLFYMFGMIIDEAAERFKFSTPFHNIKQLKEKRTVVNPFTLDEVQKILGAVRPDFKNYYTVRFFTGMRPAEIDGLKWEYVDFELRHILIRETIVQGEEVGTKNDSSERAIQMSQIVFDALKAQEKVTLGKSNYVFCARNFKALDLKNVTNRIWHPLLRHLNLKARCPYQTRHTCATLWLASGENPEWIARQMGHSTTAMLFNIYSRFVPNLTRQDGSAFERLLMERSTANPAAQVSFGFL